MIRNVIFVLLLPLWLLMGTLVALYATVCGYRITFDTTLNDIFKWLAES